MLVLVSAAVDFLTVRWVESFAPDAAGFRLRWRQRPVRGGEELLWQSADLAASVRAYTIGGLTAGTRYRLRLAALDGDEAMPRRLGTKRPGPQPGSRSCSLRA